MPQLTANGVRLAYERSGHGPAVLMISGSAAAGRVWTAHQTPALHAAGYQTVTFDNRGVAPSEAPPGRYALADLVADTRGLIEGLGLGRCRLVGHSMGSVVAQELMLDAPHLVHSAVLIATRSRSDAFRRTLSAAEQALAREGVRLPRRYVAARMALQMLSPATLDDDALVGPWLDVFEYSGVAAVSSGQVWVDTGGDRRAALRRIEAPCRVLAYADDLIAPPYLGMEVAEAIPDCDYIEIERCGHLGHLERPEQVNTAILEFLDKQR